MLSMRKEMPTKTAYKKQAQTDNIEYILAVAYCKYLNGWQMATYRSKYTAAMNIAENPVKTRYTWVIVDSGVKLLNEMSINAGILQDHTRNVTIPMIMSLEHKHPKIAFDGVCSDEFFTNAIIKGPFRNTTMVDRISWQEIWNFMLTISQPMIN